MSLGGGANFLCPRDRCELSAHLTAAAAGGHRVWGRISMTGQQYKETRREKKEEGNNADEKNENSQKKKTKEKGMEGEREGERNHG